MAPEISVNRITIIQSYDKHFYSCSVSGTTARRGGETHNSLYEAILQTTAYVWDHLLVFNRRKRLAPTTVAN